MNARQLTTTATEVPVVKAALATGERLWLVREGVRWGTAHLEANAPPVEFVQACAPCKRCLGHRWVPGDRNGLDYGYHPNERNHCPDCRIQLGQPCCECDGAGSVDGDRDADTDDAETVPCAFCDGLGFVTLAHAYAVGSPLPIIRGWSRPDGNSSGDVLSVWKGHYGPDLVMQRAWNATAIQTQYADRTAALAHYGPPESLVGKWAMCIEVKKERT